MSTASERLARYIAAESAILEGQEVRMEGPGGYKVWRGADLDVIRKAIEDLRRDVAAERAAASGAPTIGGLTFSRFRLDS